MTVRVFLSATFADLLNERLQVIEVFRRLRAVERMDIDLITMEDFGFSSLAPIDKCFEKLNEASAYLGLLGQRYGSIAPGSTLSYTELEYRHAHDRRIPIYVLERVGLVDSSLIEDDPSKLKKLKRLREHARRNHVLVPFKSSDDLGKLLVQFLPKELLHAFPEAETAYDDTVELVPYFRLRDQVGRMSSVVKVPLTLDVVAISGIGLIRDRSLIEGYLRSGCHIRMIIVRSGGLAERLITENADKPTISEDLMQVADRVSMIQDIITTPLSGALEVRCLDWVPSTSLYLLDTGRPSAVGWIGPYTPDLATAAGEKWVVELSQGRGREALDFYVGQFESLWKRATALVM